jgi:hypothetical protein
MSHLRADSHARQPESRARYNKPTCPRISQLRNGIACALLQSVNDVVHTYSEVVRDPEGRGYVASVHALERIDGIWETWLEFRGLGRDVTLRTRRESEQANRRAVLYWASGLQPSYLDGALLRATRTRLIELRTMFEGRAA